MRNVICIVLFLLVLTSHARAAELPEDLTDAPVSYTHLTLPTTSIV